MGTPTKIAIIDHEKKRTLVMRKDGLPDAGKCISYHTLLESIRFSDPNDCPTTVVVWNPWNKKARSIPDFGDDDYKRTLCVGAANVEKPITLKPGEEWTGRIELSLVGSSYCSGQLDPQKVLRGG